MKNKFYIITASIGLILFTFVIFNIQKEVSLTNSAKFNKIAKLDLMDAIMSNVLVNEGVITSFQYKNGIIKFKAPNLIDCAVEIDDSASQLNLTYTTTSKINWFKSTKELESSTTEIENLIFTNIKNKRVLN